MFFAEDGIKIPLGFDNWLENAIAVLLIAALLSHLVRGWMPKPAMDVQLLALEARLMERLDKQDEDFRAHLNVEVYRIHERIDTHGRELYRLQGFVDGWKGHKV